MKKIIFFILIFLAFIFVYSSVNALSYDIVIPDAAIRVRVIAHSNSLYDQSMKMKVKKYIEDTISLKLMSAKNIDDARVVIKSELDMLDKGINDLFLENNYSKNYEISFGNFYFPEKDYKGVHYDDGEYESLVVKIGDAEGDNWWCVLFPPLCLLESDRSNVDDVEYQFFVKKLLDQIF